MTAPTWIFIFITSILFALLEIQIEGEYGWAKNLPTWKLRNPFRKIVNWEYLTGYHFYLWGFLFFVFHLPFFVGLPLTLKNEFLVLEILFIILMLEDFMWFLLNPKWGLKRFFTEEIPWHSKKVFFFPRNYWLAVFLVILMELIRLTYF